MNFPRLMKMCRSLGFKFEDCQIKDFDKEKVLKMFQEFEFVSLLKRVPGFEALSPKPDLPAMQAQGRQGAGQWERKRLKRLKGNLKFTEIKKRRRDSRNLVKKIHEEKRFACRALLSGKDVYTAQFLAW